MTSPSEWQRPPGVVLCGSLSLHPVSLGAAMHRAGYEALGLPWVYVPFAVRSEDLPSALAGMRALSIRGFGVSMPFKLEVLPLVDRLDDHARRIGAANTIVNDGRELVGFNTDAEGAARALQEVAGEVRGLSCLVLGGGGAARAVADGLVARGAKVTVANRTADKAREIAAACGATPGDWEEVTSRRGPFDAVVNATSVGMDQRAAGSTEPLDASARFGGFGVGGPTPSDPLRGTTPPALDASARFGGFGVGGPTPSDPLRGTTPPALEAVSPLADSVLGPGMIVMDIVYRPVRTALLERAAAAGATTIHGGRMLLWQAARQFELYTQMAPPLAAMDRALTLAIGS